MAIQWKKERLPFRESVIEVKMVVVVDDILSSGRSVAAVVLALRESGFILKSTPVFVAAVLSAVEREALNGPIGEEETAKDRLADYGGA